MSLSLSFSQDREYITILQSPSLWIIPLSYLFSRLKNCMFIYWISTGRGEIVYRYCPNRLPVLAKSSIWPIPVDDFVNTGRWFQNVGHKDMHNSYVIFICMHCQIRQYWWTNWPIPVDDLANSGKNRFGYKSVPLKYRTQEKKMPLPPS